jgi:hypothetical protein
MKVASAAALVSALGVAALASSPARGESSPEPEPSASAPAIAPRPWLYLDDPSLPGPMHAIALTHATYTADPSPTRPFGANLARPGAVIEVGGELGVWSHLSLAASAFGGGLQPGFGALAGLRWAPLEGLWKTTHAVFSTGWLRELNGVSDGLWLRVAIAQDIRKWRLGAMLHGEHVLSTGRDSVDVLFVAGASYLLAGPLRAGIEYVAQDLEESFADQAEGGARQFVGPQVALELLDKHLSLAGGPAVGIGPQSPAVSGRLSAAYEY